MQKYLKYVAAGGIVVVFVVVAIYSRNKMSSNEQANRPSQSEPQTVKTVSSTSEKTLGTQSSTKPATSQKAPVTPKPAISKSAPQSYVDASEKYKKSGYYIQFYPCQATPGSLIVKQGSKIMLDNRDSKAHSIGIKNDKYLIASYNYAIATLNNIGTNYVTCDGGGSASITVVP